MTTLLTVGAIFIAVIFLFLFYTFTIRKERKELKELRENYDVKTDLSKQGEIKNGSFYSEGGRERGVKDRESGVKRFDKPQGRSVLPPKPPVNSRKDRKRPRGIFRKFRR